MINPKGKSYRRWTRKGECPGCGVKTGSDHSPGCPHREALIAGANLMLTGIPIFEDSRILDHQAVAVGEQQMGNIPYTMTFPIMIIDLNENKLYGHTDINIKEIRVSKAGKPKFLALLKEHGVVEHLKGMAE